MRVFIMSTQPTHVPTYRYEGIVEHGACSADTETLHFGPYEEPILLIDLEDDLPAYIPAGHTAYGAIVQIDRIDPDPTGGHPHIEHLGPVVLGRVWSSTVLRFEREFGQPAIAQPAEETPQG
jgi:hypothetical protein